MKKLILLVSILCLLLYSEACAQNRNANDVLRNTDTSRRREEPTRQEHQRPVNESGKIRELPRNDPPPRKPERVIDNPSSVSGNLQSYYITHYDVVEDYSFSADIYMPETTIIYTSEKEQALDLLENEWYDSAIRLLTTSIEKNSKDLELYYLRGIAEIRAEYYNAAIEDFDYYLKFFDEDGEGYYRRGLAKFLDHNKDDAREDFNIAIAFGCGKAKQFVKKYY